MRRAAAAQALPSGLALVPGMELSCHKDGHSVHLLAYLFDPAYPELAAETEAIRSSRVERARQMVDRLAALRTSVTWEQVRAIAGDGVVGRPHIARAMVQAGVISSPDDAFDPPGQSCGRGQRARTSGRVGPGLDGRR
jgi:predicted metal-dependent phosphoesterase TrpH